MGSRVGVAGRLEPEDAVESVLAGYRRHLLLERGLSEATVACYEPRARLFLAQREGLEGLGLDRLTAADVSGFLARECPLRGAASARLLVAVVRSVLRYLHRAGLIAAPLAWAVPAVAAVRGRSLPRGLEPAAVAALLGGCDRRRTVGRRDYAILLLLARLGLRASEVAGIALEAAERAGLVLGHARRGLRELREHDPPLGRATSMAQAAARSCGGCCRFHTGRQLGTVYASATRETGVSTCIRCRRPRAE